MSEVKSRPAKKTTSKMVAKSAVVKKVTPIEAYTPPSRDVVEYHKLPLKYNECDGLYAILDSITIAAERGQLTVENWVKEIFCTRKDFEDFLDDLSGYDELYRITDRWWFALAALVGTGDEEYFSRTEDIANELRQEALRTGQL